MTSITLAIQETSVNGYTYIGYDGATYPLICILYNRHGGLTKTPLDSSCLGPRAAAVSIVVLVPTLMGLNRYVDDVVRRFLSLN